MRIRSAVRAVLACVLLPSLPVLAQTMRPGLWEMTNQLGSSNGQMQALMAQMQKQLANMSPQQRQAMQSMMEKNGVQFDLGANGAMRTKACMTRDMVERKEIPMQQGDCSYNTTPLTANRSRISFICSKPRASGDGELTVDTPTSFHVRMTMRSAEQANQTMELDASGRWLGAECGSIRPIPIPRAK